MAPAPLESARDFGSRGRLYRAMTPGRGGPARRAKAEGGRPTDRSGQTRPGGVRVREIVSGGQTGADRAALDWAIARGLRHGGWCPKGRRAEDGAIPRRYRLRETPSSVYVQRTEWNVRDSDATVIMSVSPTLTGGSRKTAEFAARHRRPWLHVSAAASAGRAGGELRSFLSEHRVAVLNVAGPRASVEPGIGDFVRATLDQAFA